MKRLWRIALNLSAALSALGLLAWSVLAALVDSPFDIGSERINIFYFHDLLVTEVIDGHSRRPVLCFPVFPTLLVLLIAPVCWMIARRSRFPEKSHFPKRLLLVVVCLWPIAAEFEHGSYILFRLATPIYIFAFLCLVYCIGLWAHKALAHLVDYPARMRARRLVLGLCVHCGYSLRGNISGICPECGKAAPARR